MNVSLIQQVSFAQLCRFAALLSLTLAVPLDARAAEPNWAKIEGRNITLFSPATMSWERLFTPRGHSGQKEYREGKNCLVCHGDIDEKEMGKHLVKAGGYIEPRPIADKPGWIVAKVKTAHDAENFYIQVEFDEGAQPNAQMDKDFETKVAVILDDGSVPEASRAGCWMACHSNMASMSASPTITATKYLPESRVSMGSAGGDQIKPEADLAKLREAGNYLEYWQGRLKADGTVSVVDGTILEKRSENAKPVVTATAKKTGTTWTVTFARKKIAGRPHKDIKPGKTYPIAIAIHAGFTAQRYHYVSLERKLVLDSGKADFVAALQK
ncbi:MAG: cytochrome c-552 precursor [Rhodospirillaceae bacterium]|nr:cytochrome c-552 precursor [Rhodospirillaceae bacterium]